MSETPRTIRWLGFPYLTGRRMSPLHLTALALLDGARLLRHGRTRPAPAPPLAGKRIVVAKLDHLGDVLMATPLLRELKAQAPGCRIDLLLGSWCREIGEILRDEGLCDGFFFHDSLFLDKGPGSRLAKLRRHLATGRAARERLRECDVFVDLRPFSPNAIPLARAAGVPHRVGFGVRGGAFLLHQEIPFEPGAPLGQLFLGALPLLGLRDVDYAGPVLPRWAAAPPSADPALPPRYAAIHPFSREAGRMIPDALWLGFAERAARALPLVVLGAPADAGRPLAAALAALPGVTSLVGKTSFRAGAEAVRGAAAFAGVDSVFAHVALAFRKPAFLLWREGISNPTSFPAGNPLLRLSRTDGPEAAPDGLAAAFLAFALPAA